MDVNLPPCDIDAEEALIAALMVEPETVWDVASLVEPRDFFREHNGWIFAAELSLAAGNQPVNQISVGHELYRMGRLEEAGGAYYLSKLVTELPTAVGVEHYAKMVREAAQYRRLITAAHDISEKAQQASTDIGQLVGDAMNALMAAVEGQDEAQTIGQLATKWLEEKPETRGVKLGFPSLHFALPNVRAGDVMLIAATTSVGKTALASQIARNVALGQGKSVALATLEMSPDELFKRLLALEAGIDLARIKNGLENLRGDEQAKANRAIGDLTEAALHIRDCVGWTVEKIGLDARRLQVQHGLDLLIIDYLQLVAPGKRAENATQEVTAISRSVKHLARSMKIPVIALCQLNRKADEVGRPQLSHLRQSGALEQDADIVMLLDWVNRNEVSLSRKIDMIIAKNRNGPLRSETFTLMAATGRFIDPMEGC